MAGFLDKVVVGLNKGINSVSEGSKYMVERAQLNTQISDAEKARDKLFQNIGNLVYNLQSSGEIDVAQCRGMFDETTKVIGNIDALKNQLQELEAQRRQNAEYSAPLQNGVTCGCGFTNKEGAKFCAKCGNPL